MYRNPSLDHIIAEASKSALNERLPDTVEQWIRESPSLILQILPYFSELPDKSPQIAIVLKLIVHLLDEIRYGMDRNSQQARELFDQIQRRLSVLYQTNHYHKFSKLSAVLYDSRLPFQVDLSEDFLNKHQEDVPDIFPVLPEMLEAICRSQRIHSSFELYDCLMSQLQIMPSTLQLALVYELLTTTKPLPYEIVVMMLLHPRAEIRQQIARLLLDVNNKKLFTPQDTRRLLVIRDWLPPQERSLIAQLIRSIRLQGIAPAPFPTNCVVNLAASPFDGAGAQLILFQAKQSNRRFIGSFIAKQGVGIREPWVSTKAVKQDYDKVCQEKGMVLKPVTLAYVNKLVQHFLAEGHKIDNIPSPALLHIAELMGAQAW